MQIQHLKLFNLLLLALCIYQSSALPVQKEKKTEKPVDASTPATPQMQDALEYERYLKEVVDALESDPEFRKKLDHANEADIRSGKIAQELDYVNHHVRNKLDEIKRREMDRMRSLADKIYELSHDIDRDHLKVPQHLDHVNEHTFEIEDLRKLIVKTSNDLAENDRKRQAEFKEYEMQKEFEHKAQMAEMDEEHRKKFEAEYQAQQEKHKKHEKVHHPGSKAQLEEVWEKQDHMSKEDFDNRQFFSIHDLDSNGFWDQDEVKAIFIKELDKVYQQSQPEDDMRERAEEMERMREHYFGETDLNHDGLISLEEFLKQSQKAEYNQDPEWETVDQKPQYTHEEYLEFERRRQEEVQRMVAQGLLPPHPNMPQGYYPADAQAMHQQQYAGGYPQQQQQQPPQQMHYQQPQQQHVQQQQQYQQQQAQYAQHQQYQQQQQPQPVQLNPNQVYQHVAVEQQQPNQAYQQQVPQQQQQYKQVPQQQQQHVPQQQPNQGYQQVQQQAVPVANAQQQQQVPVQQQQQQQLPVQQQQQLNNNQVPPVVQNQQIPVQQQQQQQQQKPVEQTAQQSHN